MKRLIGIINGYTVWVEGEEIAVYKENNEVTRQEARLGIGRFLKFIDQAQNLQIGYARLPDFDVIYLYDANDDNFGYAVNLQAPDCSEWGYSPFEV